MACGRNRDDHVLGFHLLRKANVRRIKLYLTGLLKMGKSKQAVPVNQNHPHLEVINASR
jgi:hypothetical protein